ncbi:MAG: hypothetical protein DMF32_11135 [Verrucomicrobia bacterium]|nr:MAG: hypothetical protein DMF32_11135 [Verrucomicrobiota bacterium]
MVLVADRKHERRQQSSASVIKFVSAHRFVDVPHQDCPPTATRNLAIFECGLIIDASASPLPNVFLPLCKQFVDRRSVRMFSTSDHGCANARDNPNKFRA